MDFDDYSDDGELFIDGTITYAVNGTSVQYNGDLEFSGTYSGNVRIDVAAGPSGATGTYTVNGQTINL